MKFIKKDIDKRLLILVIVLLVLFAASSVYYEVTYGHILKQYKKNQLLINELTANAVIDDLNKTSSLKENIIQYKDYLDKRYDEVNTLNEKLKEEIASLRNELALVKSQIDYQKAKEVGPTSQFRLFQGKVEEINTLKQEINELCLKLKSYNITEAKCSENQLD